MNFQQVAQANGQKLMMFGVFTQVGGAEFSQQNKPKSKCKIRDDNGEEHTVHIYQGKGQLPMPQNLGQRYQFNLSTFQGNHQGQPYTGYSGFWQSNAQVNQNNPQSTPQVPQGAPQSTNYQQPTTTTLSQKDACICRQTAGKVAAEVLQLDNIPSDADISNEIIRIAEPIAQWFLTGVTPSKNLQWQQSDDSQQPQATDEDIPY